MTTIDWLPVITAISTAIPAVLGALALAKKKHRTQAEKERKLIQEETKEYRKRLLEDTKWQLEVAKSEVAKLQSEKNLVTKKLAFTVNFLAEKGLYNDITKQLFDIEKNHG